MINVDSNSLNKRFYFELLYIMGLTEVKQDGKKLIHRKKEGDRSQSSLLENAIYQLDILQKINQLKNYPYQLFNIGLELVITWINRILFLKLLEAQLITYNRNDKDYSFLNSDKIKNYDEGIRNLVSWRNQVSWTLLNYKLYPT